MNFKAINLSDRFKLLKVFLKLPFISSDKNSEMNVKEWLRSENQSRYVQDTFWKILAVGALNTSIEKSSAKIFIDILKQIFLSGNKSTTIVLPKFGLSESYCRNAEKFILENGGVISLSESVESIIIKENSVTEIQSSKQNYSDFDYVISTIPAFTLERSLKNESSVNLPDFKYSTILNIHIWLKKNVFPDGFFGLINSPVHWVFNKGTYLNIVISDADELVNKSDKELIEIVKSELQKFFLLDPAMILNYKIIKEKRATFIPSNDIIDKRPSQKTHINNLVLAGDWVDTGLPSTIESAVKSGRFAADLVMSL